MATIVAIAKGPIEECELHAGDLVVHHAGLAGQYREFRPTDAATSPWRCILADLLAAQDRRLGLIVAPGEQAEPLPRPDPKPRRIVVVHNDPWADQVRDGLAMVAYLLPSIAFLERVLTHRAVVLWWEHHEPNGAQMLLRAAEETRRARFILRAIT